MNYTIQKQTILTATLFLLLVLTANAQGYKNPILPGFYPDPSVCRVGEDYYMVNSSFHYFPGLPVHHSKDLVHWEQIGHCLTRASQTKLEKIGFWNGIYAPTIRHHNGVFYVVSTNTSDKGNFYVHTQNPAGEWSDPVWVDQGGIDPDLFFDDDGKCYFLSANWNIQICEIDLSTGKRLSESHTLWRGTGGRCAEAPHLYKKDGWYYLLIAEGGTEYGHKVTIARSRSLHEAFQANPANPILTHINENAVMNPIQGVGHADLVQAHDGSWWAVCLGFRPQTGLHHLLGRETFLAPVRWDKNAWPVVNGDGTLSLEMDVPTLPQTATSATPERDDFDTPQPGMVWNHLCTPYTENYSFTARKGHLRLQASTVGLDDVDSPTFLGRRQQHINFRATTCLDTGKLLAGSEAGLTAFMGTGYHYDLAVVVNPDNRQCLRLTYRLGRMKHVAAEVALKTNKAYLRIAGSNEAYSFSYSEDNKTFHHLADMDTRFLSTETAGGFTGVYIGMYAWRATEGEKASVADFDWFDYRPE